MAYQPDLSVQSPGNRALQWASSARSWLSRRYPERKVLLVVACSTVVLLGASTVLTFGEQTSRRSTVQAGTAYDVPLHAGEELGVYLPAFEGIPLQFDVYSFELTCELRGPDGSPVPGFTSGDRGRAVDGWARHAEVMRWLATTDGTHRVACIHHANRTYDIVLAVGAEAWRTPIEPVAVVGFSALLVGPIWLLVLVGSVVVRGAGRLARCRSMRLEGAYRSAVEVDEAVRGA